MDRRQHVPGPALRGARHRRRRRHAQADLGRLDPGQDSARCRDARPARPVPALRLRPAQGLCHQRAPGSRRPARPLRDSPPQLLRGRRFLPGQPVHPIVGRHGRSAAHPQLPAVLRGDEALQCGQAARPFRLSRQAPEAHLRRRLRRERGRLARGHGEDAPAAGARTATGKVAKEVLVVAGREVAISNPGKVLFPKANYTKLDLARYYLAVADGALRGAGGRPNVLVRYPDGIDGEFFYQKRAPSARPDWIEVATIRFPSGRTAEEVVPRDADALAWLANLACLELHPHPVRAADLEHPDELRVDLDPVPGVTWGQVLETSAVVHEVLTEF